MFIYRGAATMPLKTGRRSHSAFDVLIIAPDRDSARRLLQKRFPEAVHSFFGPSTSIGKTGVAQLLGVFTRTPDEVAELLGVRKPVKPPKAPALSKRPPCYWRKRAETKDEDGEALRLAAAKRIQFTIYDDSVEGPDLDVGTTIDPADPASAVRAYIFAAAASAAGCVQAAVESGALEFKE